METEINWEYVDSGKISYIFKRWQALKEESSAKLKEFNTKMNNIEKNFRDVNAFPNDEIKKDLEKIYTSRIREYGQEYETKIEEYNLLRKVASKEENKLKIIEKNIRNLNDICKIMHEDKPICNSFEDHSNSWNSFYYNIKDEYHSRRLETYSQKGLKSFLMDKGGDLGKIKGTLEISERLGYPLEEKIKKINSLLKELVYIYHENQNTPYEEK